MSHTPGPWEWLYGHSGLRGQPTTDNADGMVLAYEPHEGMWLRDYTTEGAANAHLIAAAPELLEALKAVVNALGFHGIARDAANRAISAIAKAEGK